MAAAAATTTTKFELYILTRRDKQVQNPKIVELRTATRYSPPRPLLPPPFFLFVEQRASQPSILKLLIINNFY